MVGRVTFALVAALVLGAALGQAPPPPPPGHGGQVQHGHPPPPPPLPQDGSAPADAPRGPPGMLPPSPPSETEGGNSGRAEDPGQKPEPPAQTTAVRESAKVLLSDFLELCDDELEVFCPAELNSFKGWQEKHREGSRAERWEDEPVAEAADAEDAGVEDTEAEQVDSTEEQQAGGIEGLRGRTMQETSNEQPSAYASSWDTPTDNGNGYEPYEPYAEPGEDPFYGEYGPPLPPKEFRVLANCVRNHMYDMSDTCEDMAQEFGDAMDETYGSSSCWIDGYCFYDDGGDEIVGIVVGPIVLVACATCAVCLCRRKCRASQQADQQPRSGCCCCRRARYQQLATAATPVDVPVAGTVMSGLAVARPVQMVSASSWIPTAATVSCAGNTGAIPVAVAVQV